MYNKQNVKNTQSVSKYKKKELFSSISEQNLAIKRENLTETYYRI